MWGIPRSFPFLFPWVKRELWDRRTPVRLTSGTKSSAHYRTFRKEPFSGKCPLPSPVPSPFRIATPFTHLATPTIKSRTGVRRSQENLAGDSPLFSICQGKAENRFPPKKKRELWVRRTPVRLTSGTKSSAHYRTSRK